MKCHRLTSLLSVVIYSSLWAQNNDWTVVYLHPEGANESQALAAAGRWQGGYKSSGGNNADAHPILWKSKQGEYLDLLPEGFWQGIVRGAQKSAQVGELSSLADGPFATLWNSMPYGIISLHPAGNYKGSSALAISSEEQVGWAYDYGTGMFHAATWKGGSDTFVDLNPAAARWSEAYACDGASQGGRAQIRIRGYPIHACTWQGTPESFLDLNPADAKESVVLGMAPGVQVGWEWVGTLHKAILWHGTPESAVVMHPSNAYYSYLLATNGTTHAGYITTMSSCAQAGLWTGDDPESFFNLSVYLPPDWYCSTANAISQDKGRLYVAGTAESPEGVLEAVVWIGPAKPQTARPQNAKPDPAPRPAPRPRP